MSKELEPAQHASRYTDSEIELGLRAVAIASGNARKASTLLARQGVKVPRTTLQLWARDLHVDRYRRIQRDVMPAIYDRIAERSEAIADDLADLEEELAAQMRRQASDLSPRDTAGALRNVSVSKAVNIDKASAIRERPTEITASVDVTDLFRALASFGGVVKVNPILLGEEAIDSIATEEPMESTPSGQADDDEVAKLRTRIAELEARNTSLAPKKPGYSPDRVSSGTSGGS